MKNKILLLSVALIMFVVLSFTACSEDENTEPPAPESYTIQYTDNTGNHTINVKSGEVYSLEAIPQKTGYDFLGLFDMEEGGTQYVTSTGNSLSAFNDGRNITLFPQFKAKEYTLVLDYQGAEVTGTRQISVSFDSIIGDLPTNLTIPNKNFTGWYTEPNKAGKQIADKYGVNPMTAIVDESLISLADDKGRICLYAGFKYQEYTLTLYIGESSVPEEILVEWGTHISNVQTETRVDGNAVLTWSKSKNDTALANVFSGKVEGDMVLYSCEYAPVIDFNAMGGENVNSIVNRAGNTISLPTPKRENYTFMGWFDTTGTQFTSTAMPEASITLNAKWQANIMLNENGGTDVQDITAPAGTAIELPTPERAGYIFAGWYNGNEKYTSTAMPENSITLTAKYWKINSKKIVLINDSENEFNSYNCPVISNYNEYQNYATNYIDVSDLYNKGITTINLIAHYDVKISDTYNIFGKMSKKMTYMSWYSQPTASDAYKVWEYFDEHKEENKYINCTQSTKLNLTSGELYVTRFGHYGYDDNSNTRYHYYYWTNFWVEIEYPDMTTLY
ncbi:MAG: InlB B-repeat-containing protein [Clostridia bacterium]|nr:InlB B-repeat-containing protein [Clostridia bacterium]